MAMCRGIGIGNLRAFIEVEYGVDGWGRVMAALPPADREVISRSTDESWLESTILDRATRAACDVLGGGSLSVAARAGRVAAERNAAGTMRWLYRLIDPAFAIRNMTIYWRRGHDGGRFESVLTDDRAIATLHGWTQDRARCEVLLHTLGRTLEFWGQVSELEHPRCQSRGDPACEFRAQFHLGAVTAPPMTLQSLDDALAALREISHVADAAVVRAAVARLLARFLGARELRIWLAGEDSSQAPASAGSEGPRRRFVLEHAGVTVGLIELIPPPDPTQASLIESVVPWLGLVFARGAPGAAAAPAVVERDAEGRLVRVGEASRLTRRELDVLGRVVHGRSNKETASELGISEATVEVHVSSILRKCGVDGRGALIARFWQT